ncbi:hypothetical protein KSS87_006086 [Heliosperma pusillum]|nr:hypothetical protein KSS87_006086 [Heliosperma pusillum]
MIKSGNMRAKYEAKSLLGLSMHRLTWNCDVSFFDLIRCKGHSDFEAPVKLTFSRRDAIISLTTLASAAISISSPNTAEARISKGEMRRKIKEKLELLREKAGVSKQKESNKEKSPYAKEENNPQSQPSTLSETSLVEAAYTL